MPVLSVAELQHMLNTAFPHNKQKIDRVSDCGVALRLEVGVSEGRPGSTVSGPTLMTLADTCAWMCVLARLGPVGVMSVTTSLHMDFLVRPKLGVDLEADGELLKFGRTLAVVGVRIRSGSDVVASAQVTYSIPPPGSKL